MFKVPRVNVIESDEGFSIEFLGRTGLLYTEGERNIRIDSEVANATTIAVIKDSIRTWSSPHENEVIDDNKRDSIIENIRQALLSQLKNIEVD